MSAFGLSDHITIGIKSKARAQVKSSKSTKQVRDLQPSKRHLMRAYLQQVNASNLIDLMATCKAKVNRLETIVSIGINFIMKSASIPGDEVYRSLEIADGTAENVTKNLAHIINESFISPMNDFMPLSNDFLTGSNINSCTEPAFAVATEGVFIKLEKLNPYCCKSLAQTTSPLSTS